MTVTLLVMTDGRRHCLQAALTSLYLNVDTTVFDQHVIVNDCAEDPDFADWIDTLGFDRHLRPVAGRRGFAGAINAGWRAAAGSDYIFHLEDDFVFQRQVDVRAMIDVLAKRPHIAQMALCRQPCNDGEAAAGGVIELQATEFFDHHDGNFHWLEHRCFYTTNPAVLPAWLIARGWPQEPKSEGLFGLRLFEDPRMVCAYWGRRGDQPWVHHIGDRHSTGTGY
jgi:glycosyltransferase involved in cell wall biosynthesis